MIQPSNRHISQLAMGFLRGDDYTDVDRESGVEGVFDIYVFEFGVCSCMFFVFLLSYFPHHHGDLLYLIFFNSIAGSCWLIQVVY